MRKIILSVAALAVLSFSVPYAAPAKAEDIVVHRGGDWHHHHHHHHHDKTVIIKHDHD
jgi:hypothetical protein